MWYRTLLFFRGLCYRVKKGQKWKTTNSSEVTTPINVKGASLFFHSFILQYSFHFKNCNQLKYRTHNFCKTELVTMPPSIKPLVSPTSLNGSNVTTNKKASSSSTSLPKKKVSIANSTLNSKSRESQRLRRTNRVSTNGNTSSAVSTNTTNHESIDPVEETTTTTTTAPTTSSYNPMMDQTSMMGGGYGGGMMSSPYGMGFGMGYNPYGSMMMMGGGGLPFLSSLNQLLFGFQNVVFSLGQAMQVNKYKYIYI